MRDLSIFIDESGDFGEYDADSPYYIVALVFHDQNDEIGDLIAQLDGQLKNCGFRDNYIHTHPIIRREYPYTNLSIDERRRILNKLLRFTVNCNIEYFSIVIEKKEAPDKIKLSGKIAKLLSAFIRENLKFFQEYDRIIVYYDNGQQELSIIINTILNTAFANTWIFATLLLRNINFFKLLISYAQWNC